MGGYGFNRLRETGLVTLLGCHNDVEAFEEVWLDAMCGHCCRWGHISIQDTQRKRISIRNGPLNLLSKREETEEEEVVNMGGGGSKLRVSALL